MCELINDATNMLIVFLVFQNENDATDILSSVFDTSNITCS